jgi:hypothetical protein
MKLLNRCGRWRARNTFLITPIRRAFTGSGDTFAFLVVTRAPEPQENFGKADQEVMFRLGHLFMLETVAKA